jgi:hypothetical protein
VFFSGLDLRRAAYLRAAKIRFVASAPARATALRCSGVILIIRRFASATAAGFFRFRGFPMYANDTGKIIGCQDPIFLDTASDSVIRLKTW